MKFRKYQHIQRMGDHKTLGIDSGTVWLFPKLDGANCQTYLNDEGNIESGNRRRILNENDHEAYFYHYVMRNENIKDFHHKYPNVRLYGEWLYMHTFKDYMDDAWNRFYVFDVMIEEGDNIRYLSYDVYSKMLDEFNIDYIPPIIKLEGNLLSDRFSKYLNKVTFLINENVKRGEGIVVKNYDWVNSSGNIIWAKIINSEFIEEFHRKHGHHESYVPPKEKQIVDKFCTTAFIEKELLKFLDNDMSKWSNNLIPELFNHIFRTMIDEEILNILDQFNTPTIVFGTVKQYTIDKVKVVLKDNKLL